MYTLITRIRSWFYDKGIFKSSEFDFPIINVGNLAVGGSGKTPHIEYIIRLLSEEFKVATLSRGYGRKTKGFRKVELESTVKEVGDEPLQLKTKFPSISVFVGEDRVNAVTQLLLLQPDIEVLLLDDAYQHRAIKPGLNILLTDLAKIFTRDKSMPYGRLREKPTAAKRADIIVISKCPDNMDSTIKANYQAEIRAFTEAPILFSGLEYDSLIPYNKNLNLPKSIENILLVTGIANPQTMISYLKGYNAVAKLEHLSFRDHHYFSTKEVMMIVEKFNSFAAQNKIIVLSEKDAIRLRELSKGNAFEQLPVFILPIQVSFLGEDLNLFNEMIIDYVRKNKADFSIHPE